jgi:catechol 2,3-dioxygenase-like lactoylglutathione lyase family enzyme
MRLNHLALAVGDQQLSIRFFTTYFGFDASTARRYEDGVVILRDAEGSALAVSGDGERERVPAFPHFGFEMDSPLAVRELHVRLAEDGVEIIESDEEAGYVGFKCLDPDGHVIEVFCEPRG